MGKLSKLSNENYLIYLYCFLYSLFIFCTVLKDSELFPGLINGSYLIVEVLFTFINLIFILSLKNNLVKSNLAILLIILTVLPYVLFKVQIISPFFLVIYLTMITSTEFYEPIKLLKSDLGAKVFSILVVFYASFMNEIPNNVVTRGIKSNIFRYSFGFNSPNTPDLMIISVILSLILLYKYCSTKKSRIYLISIGIFMFLLSFLLYHFTDSKECLVTIFVLLILLIIYNVEFLKPIILGLPIFVYLFSVIMSIYLSFFCNYNTEFFYYIDKITTNRLSDAVMAFSIYPVKLLGRTRLPLLSLYRNIVDPNNWEFAAAGLDNGYLADLMHLGIIGLIILSVFILYALVDVFKHKEYFSSIVLISIMIALLSVQCKVFYATVPLCVSMCTKINKNDTNKLIS